MREVILVESVKYLVVGEDAQLQVIVNKALVQCPQHGFKGDGVAPVLKDVVQALNLLGAVTQDDQFVALGQEVGERLPDEVKILVVDALRLAVQRQALDAALGSGLAVDKRDAPQFMQALDKQVGIHDLVGGLGVALVGDDGADRHAFLGNFADAGREPVLAAAQHDGVVAHIIQQRNVILTSAAR